jgi:phosphatidylserine decarboxylase
MRSFPIVPDGWVFILILGIITAFFFIWKPYLAIIPLILLIFVGFFFRNPEREIPTQIGLVVSPADGVVMNVEQVWEDRYLKSEATRVRIFLNVFNVHINRSPIAGTIEYQEYQPGKFIPANREEAAQVNEQNLIGIQNEELRILIRQIAGLVARRVVSWVNPGDNLDRGERFGLIKFGSCTELYLPNNVQVEVKKGDRVKGGETIIGRVVR